MIWRLTMVGLLLGCALTLEACTDEAASNERALVRNEIAQILANERAADPLNQRRPADAPDPCDGVSDDAVQRVEAKMQNLEGDLVVLGADDQQALACSRSRPGG